MVRHALERHVFAGARRPRLHTRPRHQVVRAPVAPVDAVLQPAGGMRQPEGVRAGQVSGQAAAEQASQSLKC